MTVRGDAITPADITARIPAAQQALLGAAYRTPLEPAPWLSTVSDAQVAVKLECYQPTGSFKVRGALAAISQLGEKSRRSGVVTASAGNHGLGVAYAAQRAGIAVTVVVPEDASPAKVAALRRFPIELLLVGADYDAAERAGRLLAAERNTMFLSPYNDPWVIAGQGTIGPELLEDLPGLDAVLIPTGGGGLPVGIGAWLKAVKPGVRIIGVQSDASPAMERALRAGRLVDIDVLPSLADGITGNIERGSVTFSLAQVVIDQVALVSEAEIAGAIKASFHELHLALEGSAVVGIAALLSGRIDGLAGKQVAVIVTGRNIAAERLCQLLH